MPQQPRQGAGDLRIGVQASAADQVDHPATDAGAGAMAEVMIRPVPTNSPFSTSPQATRMRRLRLDGLPSCTPPEGHANFRPTPSAALRGRRRVSGRRIDPQSRRSTYIGQQVSSELASIQRALRYRIQARRSTSRLRLRPIRYRPAATPPELPHPPLRPLTKLPVSYGPTLSRLDGPGM
jgi:hypothetical protein